MTAEDYVDVKLSAAGEAAAGQGGCVRVTGGDYDYCFEPGKAQRMTRREYKARLESATREGQPIFEIAPSGAKARTGKADPSPPSAKNSAGLGTTERS